ncbi:MAG: putative FMN-dependent luciferase-like monooxygenase, partial [Acetobacteraceae bacterium]|nr:putative FMN-dependent luciferase-like monooxygenase [Acetobacteraceae bacterium]
AAFAAFGLVDEDRRGVFERNLELLEDALAGRALPGGDRLYPARPELLDRMWHATFSVQGARHAGAKGAGLLLSRTQPRPADRPDARLSDIQDPMIDAYLSALPPGVAPRILASRSVFAVDDRADALRFAEIGLRRYQARLAERGHASDVHLPVEELIRRQDVHTGTPEEVVASLRSDRVMDRATDLAVQVHSIDPPHPLVLRSIELVARAVGPALGLPRRTSAEAARRVA